MEHKGRMYSHDDIPLRQLIGTWEILKKFYSYFRDKFSY